MSPCPPGVQIATNALNNKVPGASQFIPGNINRPQSYADNDIRNVPRPKSPNRPVSYPAVLPKRQMRKFGNQVNLSLHVSVFFASPRAFSKSSGVL